MGFVHHSNYLNCFEMARIEWLNKIGFSYTTLEGQGIVMPIVSIQIILNLLLFLINQLKTKLFVNEIPKTILKLITSS